MKRCKFWYLIGFGICCAASGSNLQSSDLHNSQSQGLEKRHSKVFKNYSWFLDSKKTKQEVALVPIYLRSNTYGSQFGLRFFTFSPTGEDGYYFALSADSPLVKPWLSVSSMYRNIFHSMYRRWMFSFNTGYSNYPQPYYGEGMQTSLKNRINLHTHQISIYKNITLMRPNNFFYSINAQGIFRRDILKRTISSLQKEQKHLGQESVIFLEGVAWYYNIKRPWGNPWKGQYHDLAFGCAPGLFKSKPFCRIEGNVRLYVPLHKRIVMAGRGMAGTALLNPFSYSLAYSLGGRRVLRGWTENRFRGDKTYLIQGELRTDVWKDILSGVVFLETGEVASFKKSFKGPRWSYGAGLRLGLPPTYAIKMRADLGISDEKTMNFIVDFLQAF